VLDPFRITWFVPRKYAWAVGVELHSGAGVVRNERAEGATNVCKRYLAPEPGEHSHRPVPLNLVGLPDAPEGDLRIFLQ